ncbi:MAG: sugar ABC transporter permease, partial [Spirochaetales bacterium]|nr:sugar ABC transporter permease [Spirochaetales bacterium]
MKRNETIRARLWNERWSYAFVAPTFILFLTFTVRSLIFSFYYALHEWRGIGDPDTYVALANFIDVARDPFFWNAFKNSFIFMFGVAPGQLAIGLLFALILNMKFKTAVVFRTLYFLPVITTAAIVGIIMPMIFSPILGPVNIVMVKLGLIR